MNTSEILTISLIMLWLGFIFWLHKLGEMENEQERIEESNKKN